MTLHAPAAQASPGTAPLFGTQRLPATAVAEDDSETALRLERKRAISCPAPYLNRPSPYTQAFMQQQQQQQQLLPQPMFAQMGAPFGYASAAAWQTGVSDMPYVQMPGFAGTPPAAQPTMSWPVQAQLFAPTAMSFPSGPFPGALPRFL
jgi:hypothetical protein